MDPEHYNRLARLEKWLDGRHRRAIQDGNGDRAMRLANLINAANAKMGREGCRNLSGIVAYSDFA